MLFLFCGAGFILFHWKKKIKVGLPPEGEKRNTSVNLGVQGPVASFTIVRGSISELHFEKYWVAECEVTSLPSLMNQLWQGAKIDANRTAFPRPNDWNSSKSNSQKKANVKSGIAYETKDNHYIKGT